VVQEEYLGVAWLEGPQPHALALKLVCHTSSSAAGRSSLRRGQPAAALYRR
jgi:hypothetical protein